MTYLFDRERALRSLEANEASWGGDIPTRMATQSAAYKAARTAPAAAVATKTDAAVPSDSAAVARAAAAARSTQEDLATDGPRGNTVAEDGSTERLSE